MGVNLSITVVKYGIRIRHVRLSNCFKFHCTSMISKYSNGYERKFILRVFEVLFMLRAF